jgi:hypothetical protein
MKTKDFLLGYMYAAYNALNTYPHNFKDQCDKNVFDSKLDMITIETNGGHTLKGHINRGICPKGGLVSYAFTNFYDSTIDIAEVWVNPTTWKKIGEFFDGDPDNLDCFGGEIRITLVEFRRLIDYLGGIKIN